MHKRDDDHAIGADALQPEQGAVAVDVFGRNGKDPARPYGDQVERHEEVARQHDDGLQLWRDPVAQGFQDVQVPQAAYDDAAPQVQGVDDEIGGDGAGKPASLDQHPQDIEGEEYDYAIGRGSKQYAILLLVDALPALHRDGAEQYQAQRVELDVDGRCHCASLPCRRGVYPAFDAYYDFIISSPLYQLYFS